VILARSKQWDAADCVKCDRATKLDQWQPSDGMVLRSEGHRGKYAVKRKGRCAVAVLAAARPGFVQDMLNEA